MCADEDRVGDSQLVEHFQYVGDIDHRLVIGGIGIDRASAAPAKVDGDHPPVAGKAIRHRLEIARVAGQARDA